MIYKLVSALANFLCLVLLRLEFKGKNNIPSKGPLIVASNHISNLDPIVIGAVFPRRINFLAKKELFGNPAFAWFLKKLAAFPLQREKNDISAFRQSLKILKRQNALLIFPQGSRGAKKIKAGVGFLSKKASVKVLPIKIIGTDKVLPRGKLIPRLQKVKIICGEPVNFHCKLSPEEVAQAVFEKIDSI